uniref:Uncharacterized protein n=1 Tax=Sphaerodactylus townsendi TaxID=933632 RepID=A0ACB8G4Z6_9SAUR
MTQEAFCKSAAENTRAAARLSRSPPRSRVFERAEQPSAPSAGHWARPRNLSRSPGEREEGDALVQPACARAAENPRPTTAAGKKAWEGGPPKQRRGASTRPYRPPPQRIVCPLPRALCAAQTKALPCLPGRSWQFKALQECKATFPTTGVVSLRTNS